MPAVSHAPNTGILCDGLRAVDIDIDNQTLAHQIRAVALDMLGDTIVRTRSNSGRCLLPYRAAKGAPSKRTLTGTHGKIEVLGYGNQFVAFGRHPTGAELKWFPVSPAEMPRDGIPEVTEEQVNEFFDVVAPLIGAKPESKPNGKDGNHHESASEHSADILDVIAALHAIPNDGPPDWEFWNSIGMAIWAETSGSPEGFAAWTGWSSKNLQHDFAACRERWRHYPTSPPDRTGAGKLFRLAAQAIPGWQRPSELNANQAGARATSHVINIVNPAELESVAVPPRSWIVEDWLPVGPVTGNYGDGGTGKTLLAQQLQTATAAAIPWCGRPVLQCKSFGLYCEDDENELHRRQDAINTVFKVDYSTLANMRWISGVGDDWTLVTFTNDGRMCTTKRWTLLVREVNAFGARLVVLDTAADLFGGNENDRGQVRRFISLLAGLAGDIDGAVILNCHPSRTGLTSGNLDGGSTGWNNGFRSRWSLARPEGDDVPMDTPERILTRRKANYARIGETIHLRWAAGAFAPVGSDGGATGIFNRAKVEEVFLTLLDRCEASGQRVSDSKQAGN